MRKIATGENLIAWRRCHDVTGDEMIHPVGYSHAGVHNGDLRSGDVFDQRPEKGEMTTAEYQDVSICRDERQDFFFNNGTGPWAVDVRFQQARQSRGMAW